MRPPWPLPSLLLLIVCLLTLTRGEAQTPDVVVVLKSAGYFQTSPTTLATYRPGYAVVVSFPSAVSTSTQVQLISTSGPAVALTRVSTSKYSVENYFDNQAALDKALASGFHSISASGDGAPSYTLFTLAGASSLKPVAISNFTTLQNWAGSTLTVQWTPFEGGTSGDYVALDIRRADGTVLYSSPGLNATGALNGTHTSLTIPSLNAAAGETLYGTLGFNRLISSTANSGRTAVTTGSGYYVRFPITRARPPKPVITTQPESITASLGSNGSLSVVATGDTLSYQWRKNGLPISTATNALLPLSNIQSDMAGTYTVDVSNPGGTTTSSPATLTVLSDTGGIRNLAIRSSAGTGNQTLIVGFVISGATTQKPLLIRGVGPSLNLFGLSDALSDPKLELYGPSGSKLDENDNWGGNIQVSLTASSLGAFKLDSNSRDAALLTSRLPGPYTVQVSGVNNATGIALAEIYDASTSFTASTPRLINVSARTQVGTGGDILIAGFNIGGQTARTVLIRAIGPTLGDFGVTDVLADPKLELFTGQTKLNANDNWDGQPTLAAAFTATGAFPLPSSSKDSALLVTLPPGSYTAQVSGVNNTIGVALVEVYEVP